MAGYIWGIGTRYPNPWGGYRPSQTNSIHKAYKLINCMLINYLHKVINGLVQREKGFIKRFQITCMYGLFITHYTKLLY